MTRLILAALIALTPTLAAAWETGNDSGDRSTSHTTGSTNQGTGEQQQADQSGTDRLDSSGRDGTRIYPTEELFGAYHF